MAELNHHWTAPDGTDVDFDVKAGLLGISVEVKCRAYDKKMTLDEFLALVWPSLDAASKSS